MVNATIKLLSRQGYHGTGLNEIVAEAHAPKGSMYHHFPGGKEQLVAEAIVFAGQYVTNRIKAGASAIEVAEILTDRLVRRLEKTDFADGCAIASSTLDVASISAPVRAACATTFSDWQDVLVERLVDEGAADADARRAATVVIAAVEGALVLSRATADTAPLQRVRESLPHLLDVAPR